MIHELLTHLPLVSALLGGLMLGALLARLLAGARFAADAEKLKSHERNIADLAARLAQTREEAELYEREAHRSRTQLAELQSRAEAERIAAAEKQAVIERAEARLSDSFKALSAEALRASSSQFLELAKSSLAHQSEQAQGDLAKRQLAIEAVIRPVAESLGKFEQRVGDLEKQREGAYAELRQQIRTLGDGQLTLQQETAALVKALRQPAGRGQWGEMQLKRVVELAGMLEHCDFVTQVAGTNDEGRRQRPDLVVRLPGGKSIVVDAKTPMSAYLDALETDQETTREAALVRHAQQVRTHMAQLASKQYTAQFAHTPEFTVLFLPGESFFSAALQSDPSLIEAGVKQGVILATPTTLIALLRAVAYGWREEALAENAREISALGRQLHDRVTTLSSHLTKLGRSLGTAVDHFNSAIGTYESRVLTTTRKFVDLKVAAPSQSIAAAEPIDTRPRQLSTFAQALPEPPPPSSETDFAAKPLTEDQPSNNDFGFVPNPAQAAAADLRSALE